MVILKVEIADTPSRQEQGLMFRHSLDSDAGMLFKFSNPQVLNFWGLNTYIPLDIAFVSPENKIVKIENIRPFCMSPVSSESDCKFAIEANMGFFSKNGVTEGDMVDVAKDDMGFDIISFKKNEGKQRSNQKIS